MLNGQKLQGPPTAAEIYNFLAERNELNEFVSIIILSTMIIIDIVK